MAGSLADTAKLVASLELKDKFSKNAAAFNRSVTGMERRTSTLSKIGSQASAGVGSAIRNIKLIGLAAAGALAYGIKQGLASIASIQKEAAQTVAVLKSTAGAAGQTISEVTARSQKWSAAIGVNEEDVQHLQNVLLTFTNIGPTIFDETTTAALNLSQALGAGPPVVSHSARQGHQRSHQGHDRPAPCRCLLHPGAGRPGQGHGQGR